MNQIVDITKRSDKIKILETVGKNIRAVRREKGLTQQVFAKQCDIHQNYLSEVEQGKRNITMLILEQIADALGVESSKLLDESFISMKQSAESQKPLCPFIGADGNVFNLLAIAKRSLYEAGQQEKITEMIERVYDTHSYEEALQVMMEYVEPCDRETYDEYQHTFQQM